MMKLLTMFKKSLRVAGGKKMAKKSKFMFVISIFATIIFFLLVVVNQNEIDDKKEKNIEIFQSWQYEFIDYQKVHQLSKGTGQKIALIDSGISSNDKAIDSISLIGQNMIDENGHGSMMYSLIKGVPNKSIGISPGVSIISIKVMGADGAISSQLIAKAIEKAKNQGATVINLSIGSTKNNSDITRAINDSIKSGISVVAAAGDYDSDKMMFPANLSNVISVGAIDKNSQILSLVSGKNKAVINAPGSDVMVQGVANKIFQSSGTSQATALVSGYVSLLRERAVSSHKILTNQQLIQILKSINDKEESYYSALEKLK